MTNILDDVASLAGASPVGGIIGGVVQIGSSLIDRLIPDPAAAAQAKLELLKMQTQGELAKLTMATDLGKAQLAVDQTEAASNNAYAADWRPTAGYVMVGIMAWEYALAPLLTWLTALIGHPTPMPTLDFNSISPVLMGMLGLGTMHTVETVKGVPQ